MRYVVTDADLAGQHIGDAVIVEPEDDTSEALARAVSVGIETLWHERADTWTAGGDVTPIHSVVVVPVTVPEWWRPKAIAEPAPLQCCGGMPLEGNTPGTYEATHCATCEHAEREDGDGDA